MAERRSPGFNIPLNFYDGAEVNSLPKRVRAAAIGVWSLAGNYAATQLTDGYVGPEQLRMFGCTSPIRAALKATTNSRGDLSPLWEDARDGGVQLSNWPKWQRTHAEVTTYRESEAERKRAARDAKRNASTSDDSQTSGRTNDGCPHTVPPDHRDPKTETKTETETKSFPLVTSGGGVASADAHETPRPHCPKHEENFDGPCLACKKRREWDETHEARMSIDEVERKRIAKAERDAAIAACPRCDERGQIDYGNSIGTCDHGLEADHA